MQKHVKMPIVVSSVVMLAIACVGGAIAFTMVMHGSRSGAEGELIGGFLVGALTAICSYCGYFFSVMWTASWLVQRVPPDLGKAIAKQSMKMCSRSFFRKAKCKGSWCAWVSPSRTEPSLYLVLLTVMTRHDWQ